MIQRRSLFLGAAAVMGVLALPLGQARADLDRLNLMVPAAPGGGWDSTARQMQGAFT